jgi:hypothetical protein
MEPAIPSGSHCLMRFFVPGSRSGRTVLVEERKIAECAYTLKRTSGGRRQKTNPMTEAESFWNRSTQTGPISNSMRTAKARTSATQWSPNSFKLWSRL